MKIQKWWNAATTTQIKYRVNSRGFYLSRILQPVRSSLYIIYNTSQWKTVKKKDLDIETNTCERWMLGNTREIANLTGQTFGCWTASAPHLLAAVGITEDKYARSPTNSKNVNGVRWKTRKKCHLVQSFQPLTVTKHFVIRGMASHEQFNFTRPRPTWGRKMTKRYRNSLPTSPLQMTGKSMTVNVTCQVEGILANRRERRASSYMNILFLKISRPSKHYSSAGAFWYWISHLQCSSSHACVMGFEISKGLSNVLENLSSLFWQ